MEAEIREFLEDKLEKEKANYKTLLESDTVNNEEIVSLLNSIIDLKFLLNYTGSDTLYLDLKKFIKSYILAVDNKESGYDKINVQVIYDKISKVDLTLRANLLHYLKRELIKNAFLDEADECKEYIYLNKILVFKKQRDIFCKVKWLLLLSSKNIKNLSISIILLFVIIYLVQLEAPNEFMTLFEKKYVAFDEISFFNNLANLLCMLLDLNDDIKLIPLNITGIFVLGFLKITYISIFVNYFWKKIMDYIKIEE